MAARPTTVLLLLTSITAFAASASADEPESHVAEVQRQAPTGPRVKVTNAVLATKQKSPEHAAARTLAHREHHPEHVEHTQVKPATTAIAVHASGAKVADGKATTSGKRSIITEPRPQIGTNTTGRVSLRCARFTNFILKRVVYSGTSSDIAQSFASYGKRNAAPKGGTIIGTASTYNPFRPGYRSGGRKTASGERYDPRAWTAAIQTNLRTKFGGIRHGKSYRPTYALVESGDKHAIVKINDVGPLRLGRIIDLNEQAMRYFDPSLGRGVIPAVKVTPLSVSGCSPGPLDRNI